MHVNRTTPARVARATWVAAIALTVLGPLHALARHATADGRADLDLPLTRLWAEPAAELLRPLLGWSDPDTVYLTYGKLWFPVLALATATAWLVYRYRRPRGFEAAAWWVALTGYVVITLSAFGDYWTPYLEESFLFLGVPGLLLTALASTALGITLLRRGFRPRSTGWLLAGFVPLFVAAVQVTSMGNALLVLVWAWALAGRRLLTGPAGTDTGAAATTDRAGTQPRAAELR